MVRVTLPDPMFKATGKAGAHWNKHSNICSPSHNFCDKASLMRNFVLRFIDLVAAQEY